jgi:hypothetical protein
MLNTPVITDYFYSDHYLHDLNRDNPLGYKGRIAEEYGALLKTMWQGQYRTYAPYKFKNVVGECQSRFAGYSQQDSSELLAFCLDALHEDCNQVLKKPSTSQVEWNGRDLNIVAQEAWQTHLLRNRSIIIEHCMGQLKSHLTCPVCNHQSIIFDPYMMLSVPIPVTQADLIPQMKLQEIILVKHSGTNKLLGEPAGHQMIYVPIFREGNMFQVRQAIAEVNKGMSQAMNSASNVVFIPTLFCVFFVFVRRLVKAKFLLILHVFISCVQLIVKLFIYLLIKIQFIIFLNVHLYKKLHIQN